MRKRDMCTGYSAPELLRVYLAKGEPPEPRIQQDVWAYGVHLLQLCLVPGEANPLLEMVIQRHESAGGREHGQGGTLPGHIHHIDYQLSERELAKVRAVQRAEYI